MLGCALALPVLLLASTDRSISFAHAAAIVHPQEAGQEAALFQELPGIKWHQPPGVYLLPARTQEVPGLQGLKRLALGVALMAAALVYFSKVTYPKVMPKSRQLLFRAESMGRNILGEEPLDKLEYFLKR